MTAPPDVERLVVAAAAPLLRGAEVVVPSAAVAEALVAHGVQVRTASLESLRPGGVDTLALLDDELSAAGEHAEGLIAQAVDILAPGGRIAVSALGRVAHVDTQLRGYRSDELVRALGHHGVDLELLTAPGAGALARGEPTRTYDREIDRLPGVLDVAPRLVAVGRTAGSAAARSRSFFGTLPRKVIAAAVLCQDEQGRLLVVHDTFKQHWTIPGGVVDADEDPREAAVREAWEEAGVRVVAHEVAGVFSAAWPDRVILVYRAVPAGAVEAGHAPVHAHEIDAVDWLPLDVALRQLAPNVAQQVRHCLDHPGGSLRQGWL